MQGLIFLLVAGPMLVLIALCNRALSEQFAQGNRKSRFRRRRETLARGRLNQPSA